MRKCSIINTKYYMQLMNPEDVLLGISFLNCI
jgi:hypothetical protein